MSRNLKDYLKAESRDKRQTTLSSEPKGYTAKELPEQQNLTDCGVFLIAYLTKFHRDPVKFVEAVIKKDSKAWEGLKAQKLRGDYLARLLKEYSKQHPEETEQSKSVTDMAEATSEARTVESASAKEAGSVKRSDKETEADRHAARQSGRTDCPRTPSPPIKANDTRKRQAARSVSPKESAPRARVAPSPEAPVSDFDAADTTDSDDDEEEDVEKERHAEVQVTASPPLDAFAGTSGQTTNATVLPAFLDNPYAPRSQSEGRSKSPLGSSHQKGEKRSKMQSPQVGLVEAKSGLGTSMLRSKVRPKVPPVVVDLEGE